MDVHLGRPWKKVHFDVVVLVAFHPDEVEGDTDGGEDVEDAAFEIVVRSETVRRVDPGPVECSLDALKQRVAITEEIMRGVLPDGRGEVVEVCLQEQQCR